jgi:tetratricopeptide (TPR) repeat protein
MITYKQGNLGIIRPSVFSGWFGVLLAILILGSRCHSGAAESSASATGTVDEANSTEMRTYLQLQEQLHATQLAVERTRTEAEQTSSQNMEALANRLKTIEDSLATRRSKELDAMQSSNHAMLIVAGSFAGMGFVAMLLMGYFQWRTVNRLAELSAILPGAGGTSNSRRALALGMGEAAVVTTGLPPGPSPELIETIQRLEKRVRELEVIDAHASTNGNGNGNGAHLAEAASVGDANGATESHQPASEDEASRLTSLVGKGQSLLNMDKAEEALAMFDEALAVAPEDPETLIKKGIALEKLRKLNEAIECYDRAIAADSSMTIAYLHKGGLFNRMERFNEALECYEKALHTQESRGLA